MEDRQNPPQSPLTFRFYVLTVGYYQVELADDSVRGEPLQLRKTMHLDSRSQRAVRSKEQIITPVAPINFIGKAYE